MENYEKVRDKRFGETVQKKRRKPMGKHLKLAAFGPHRHIESVIGGEYGKRTIGPEDSVRAAWRRL